MRSKHRLSAVHFHKPLIPIPDGSPSPFAFPMCSLRQASLVAPMTPLQLADAFAHDVLRRIPAGDGVLFEEHLHSIDNVEDIPLALMHVGFLRAGSWTGKTAKYGRSGRVVIHWPTIFRSFPHYTEQTPSLMYICWYLIDVFTGRIPLLADLLYRHIHVVLQRYAQGNTRYGNVRAIKCLDEHKMDNLLLQYYMEQLSEDEEFVRAFAEQFDKLLSPVALTNKKIAVNNINIKPQALEKFSKKGLHNIVSLFDVFKVRTNVARTRLIERDVPFRIASTDAGWKHRTRTVTLLGEIVAIRYYTLASDGPNKDRDFVCRKYGQPVELSPLNAHVSDFAKYYGVFLLKPKNMPGGLLAVNCTQFHSHRISAGPLTVLDTLVPSNYSIERRLTTLPKVDSPEKDAQEGEDSSSERFGSSGRLTYGERTKNLLQKKLSVYIVNECNPQLKMLVDNEFVPRSEEPTVVFFDVAKLYQEDRKDEIRRRAHVSKVQVALASGCSLVDALKTKKRAKPSVSKVEFPTKFIYEVYFDIPADGAPPKHIEIAITRWRHNLWFGISTDFVFNTNLLYDIVVSKRTKETRRVFCSGIRCWNNKPSEGMYILFTAKALVKYVRELSANAQGAYSHEDAFKVHNTSDLERWLLDYSHIDANTFNRMFKRRNNKDNEELWSSEEDNIIIKYYRPRIEGGVVQFIQSQLRNRSPSSISQRATSLRAKLIFKGVWDIDELPHGRFNHKIGLSIKETIESQGKNYCEEMKKIRNKKKEG